MLLSNQLLENILYYEVDTTTHIGEVRTTIVLHFKRRLSFLEFRKSRTIVVHWVPQGDHNFKETQECLELRNQLQKYFKDKERVQ